MRELWSSPELADYIRAELGFPGVRPAALAAKTATQPASAAPTQERWYLLTSLPPERCGPDALLQRFRQRWSVENSLHHVKDRSWDEDRHTRRRPGLGEIFAALVNAGLNVLRWAQWLPPRMSLPLRAKTCCFRRQQAIAHLTGHLP